MIRAIARTDVVNYDLESFVTTILKGIEVADSMSAGYTLEITRDDVAVIAAACRHITNVEFS